MAGAGFGMPATGSARRAAAHRPRLRRRGPTRPAVALARVSATRYVTPLREGGSLPAVMETDDLGTYVVKFRGAGQGRKALVAEVITGQLARGARAAGAGAGHRRGRRGAGPRRARPGDPGPAAGQRRAQPRASTSCPARSTSTPPRAAVDGELAGQVLWFDALIGNADRSWRNPNLLFWHGGLYLIDHGATLTFQHRWSSAAAAGDPALRRHRARADRLRSAGRRGRPRAGRRGSPRSSCARRSRPCRRSGSRPSPAWTRSRVSGTAYVSWILDRLEAREAWLPGLRDAAAAAAGARS